MKKKLNNPVNIESIIKLVKKQKPPRQDLIDGLMNCIGGEWSPNGAYYRYVSSKNANKIGAEWQFEDSIRLEHPVMGSIVIDILKDKRIGGIEFLDKL